MNPHTSHGKVKLKKLSLGLQGQILNKLNEQSYKQ